MTSLSGAALQLVEENSRSHNGVLYGEPLSEHKAQFHMWQIVFTKE